ncbi:MAG TPA: TonB-dependent receptor [Bacteroidales bacterium]|nr:TonB-dependent receptor [Bacteroidales bacterium]HPT20367.1 TonB-dependent receptor [Bacteroidales bacterium]
MRNTLLLLFIAVLQVYADDTYSQSTRLTLNLKNVAVADVLEEIENNSEFYFLFNSKLVDVKREVSISFKDEKISDILHSLFLGSDVDYLVYDKQIILTPGDMKELPASIQQKPRITGTVKDENGNPLPGVNVQVEGTIIGAITDIDGKYSIEKPGENTIISFSFIGYNPQKISASGMTSLDVIMTPDVKALEEVIVIGYGTQKKSDLTGAVSSIKMEELKGQSIVNVEQMLTGTVAGVNTISASGLPGGKLTINIRGIGTLHNTDPLYVVDGVQTRDISLINPNDIESMEVLKDASTSAIYGSSGANGVILITTKKGKEGKPVLSFDTKLGIATHGKKIAVLNASDYVDYVLDLKDNDVNDAFRSKLDWRRVDRTDWQDEIYQSAFQQEYNLSVMGGTSNVKYSLGAGYVDQDGIVLTHNYKRYSFRANTEFSFGKRVKIGENLTVSYSNASEAPSGGNILLSTLRLPTYLPVLDPTNLGGYSKVTSNDDYNDAPNPVADLMLRDNKTHELRTFGNLYGTIDILKGLNYRTSIAVDLGRSDVNTFTQAYSNANFTYPSILDETFSWGNSFIYENVLSYTRQFGLNDLLILAGNSISKSSGRYYSLTGSDFTNDQVRVISAGTGKINNNGTGANQSAKLGYFARINYAYANKYLFQANFRADASYNFAPKNRWGYFPAFSLGWKMNEENFIKDNFSFINLLKLRAGWGKSGNDLIDAYGYSAQVSSFYPDYIFGNTPVTGSTIISLWNPDIIWETSATSDIGLDLSIFNDKIHFTADYFIKNTEDILVEYPMPSSTGIGLSGGSEGSAYRNAASVVNKGLELTVDYKKITQSDFTFTVSANATFIKNEVTSLGEGLPILSGDFHGNSITKTEKDNPIGSFYGYRMDKVYSTQAEVDADNQKAESIHGAGSTYQENAQAGDIRFVDADKDGWITDKDKTFIGNPIPKVGFGLALGAGYKGFDFSANFTGVYGNEIFYSDQYWLEGMTIPFNASVKIKDRWQKEGDVTSIPRAASPDANQNTRISDRWVHDGSYVRLKNLSLGYTIPADLLKRLSSNSISNLRMYVTAQNLLTITNYPGFDPEINSGSNLAQGIDTSQYPQSKLFMLGLQINF